MKYKVKKRLVYVLGLFAIGMWFYSGKLESDFIFYPIASTPELGRVVPFVVKGKVVYVSTLDKNIHDFLFYGSMILITLNVALFTYLKKKDTARY